jgi:hypothetical protein
MENRFNIFRYVTYNNPNATRELLLQNGFNDVPKNYEQVSKMLAQYYMSDPNAIKNILSIHPDLDAMRSFMKSSAIGIKEENGEFLSCSGCPNNPNNLRSADAAPEKEQKGISEKTTNTLIIGGSLVLASIMISVIITAAIHSKSS